MHYFSTHFIPAWSWLPLFSGRRPCATILILTSSSCRRLLVAGLQSDAGLLKKSTWPTAVVRRAVAFMAPGGSPTKKPQAGSERSGGQQLSKSGGRSAAAPSGDEEDSDEALAPRRRSGDAAPIPLRKDRSEKTSAPKGGIPWLSRTRRGTPTT